MPPPPSCPRCAYDLSGQVAAYESSDPSSCALLATCPECGLEFAWADVFSPARQKIRGFVEHSHLWLTPLTAWRTWSWTILPPLFWSKVLLEHRPRLRRLALWIFFVLLAPWLLSGFPFILGGWPRTIAAARAIPPAYLFQVFIGPWHGPYSPQQPASADPVLNFIGDYPIFICVGVVTSLMFPLVFLCLPFTRAKARVRARHIARAAAYQLAWLVPVMLAKAAQLVCYGVQLLISLRRSAYMVPVPGQPGALTNPTPLADWERAFYQFPNSIKYFTLTHWLLWLALFLSWWLWWWWYALSRGFRLQQPLLTYSIILLPTLLAAAITLLLHPLFLREVL